MGLFYNVGIVGKLNQLILQGDILVKRQRIRLTGRVQGVGCRPFIYTMASQHDLTGLVYNDTNGVTVEVQGPEGKIAEFLGSVQSPTEKPALLEISGCRVQDIPPVSGEKAFVIQTSDAAGTPISQVMPDTATCQDCLNEMADGNDFRYRYPFINCTNCGPRYSIVKTIPYDRPNTTMGAFEMCSKCRAQYEDVADRRFHAQPVACPECGPKIWLADSADTCIETDTDAVIAKTAQLLCEGKIVAIKGIGGFHLAVDALNDGAVARLRRRKRRDHKPFAMMTASVEKVRQYAMVNEVAQKLLTSPASPIVLLDKKPGSLIAPSVAEGVNTFGFMLCYGPLHHLLFGAEPIEVLVMTSGNISDEPLVCTNEEALERLGDVADVFLMHDRRIYRRIDDSLLHIVDDQQAFLRRARGYVPAPIFLDKVCGKDIFAAGGDLKNTFCFVKQNQLILSEHIGDLEDGLVYRHYVRSVKHLQGLFEVEPKVVVCDLHPGYLSTQYAETLGADRLIKVQHHWAHIASVLAEHNCHERVIGLAADGTGLGTDGAIWGCECLIASLTEFERFGHLAYYPLAGADKAAKEAIRPILGLLKNCSNGKDYLDKYQWLLESIEPDAEKLRIIASQLEKNLNTVQTSSLGRLFDAVAAILGLGGYNHFEAQLPMALESIVAAGIDDSYGFQMTPGTKETLELDFRTMVGQVIEDIKKGQRPEIVSARFHNSIAGGLLTFALEARKKHGLTTVALSGGVFCNRYLANRLISMLKEEEFSVLFNRNAPVNDGSIALGQAAIAAQMLGMGL
jgi:hydrogenase maturation protein HypF